MTRKIAFKQIPQIPRLDNPALTDFLVAVKQRLDTYQGNIADGSAVVLRSELSDLEEDCQKCSCDDIDIGTFVIEDNLWNALKISGERNFTLWDDQEKVSFLSCYRNGGVYLYYDGERRLATANEGVEFSNNASDIITTIGPQTIESNTWHGIQISGIANFTIYDKDNSKSMIGAYRNGGTYLYYDGDKKLETTINGIKITGNAGANIVTEIGPQTIEAATWQGITITGNANFCIYDVDNSNAMISAYRTEGVYLYYDGDRKLETTTNGIKTTGYNEISNLSATMKIGPQTIEAATWQGITITGNANFCIYDVDNSNAMIGAYRGEGIFLYYNGTKRLETTSVGATVTGQIKITGGSPGAGKVLTSDAAGLATWSTSGSGDVVGPSSATDNAICRFDSTTGKLIQNSLAVVDDTGNVLLSGGGEVVLNNAKYLLCKNSAGTNRYGIGLNASNNWQLARDGNTVSIGYGDSNDNPIMIRINGMNDQQLIRSPDTDSQGKHYVTLA